jgi:hypothetical protein
MSKSPINFLGGAIAGALIGRRGKKKTARALKKIDKRLGGIEETLKSQGSEEAAVPEIDASMDAVDDNAIETPDMNQGMEPVPGAVDALQEDSFATAGDSGLNMVRKIMRRNK